MHVNLVISRDRVPGVLSCIVCVCVVYYPVLCVCCVCMCVCSSCCYLYKVREMVLINFFDGTQ